MDNPSVVAQLMAQIDSEISAMQQVMNGFSSVARHGIITHRFENLGVCFEVLSVHIGEQAAIETILKKLEESV